MNSGELISVDPLEMKFPFELKKQISCSLIVTNKTDDHVAFKVKTTNPKKYCVRPNTGIILPHSTCDVIVTMQAQKEAPPDMQCKDKFLIQSVLATPGATTKDITPEMFNKEQAKVEEYRLKVAYVSPRQPPSPVAEGSEEGFSPRTAVSETSSEASRMFADSHDKSADAKSMVSKLTEEKAAAVKQSNMLRQELDVMKKQSSKGGGISLALVLVIGILGVVLGYFMRSP